MCWTFLQEYWTKNIDSFKEDFHERGSFRAHRSWRDGHGARKNAAFLRARRPSVRCRQPPAKRTKPSCWRCPARRMCAFSPRLRRCTHSGLIDAVLIATPHRLHVQQAVEAFRAGDARFARKADGRFHTGGSPAETRKRTRVAGRSAPCSISAPTPLIGK